MKNILCVLLTALVVISCADDKKNMIVTGQIKGLKKGKLYLQKMKDTALISVDSVSLFDTNNFQLSDQVDSPVLYYLTFDGNTTNKRILFFGEEGTITIHDNIDKFGLHPKIKGSKNQELLEKYQTINKQFNNERLALIKQELEAKQKDDKKLLKEVQERYKKLQKRRILYTANYAISHKNFEVAPYIALTEMYSATTSILDTVHNSLTNTIKSSTYGKRFTDYLTKVKTDTIK